MAWGSAFQQLHGYAMGAFMAMVNASPALGAEMFLLSWEFTKLAMVLGNDLAPYLEDVRILIGKLTNWIAGLPEPIREWIVLTIALTVVLTFLAIALLAVVTAGAPVILTILVIAASIAVAILITKHLLKVWDDLSTKIKILISVWLLLMGPLGWMILTIILLVKHMDELKAVIQIVKDALGKFSDVVSSKWSKITTILTDAISEIIGIFEGLSDIWSNLPTFLTDAISEIIGVFAGLIAWIRDTFMSFWNKIFGNSEFSDAVLSAYNEVKDIIQDIIGLFDDIIKKAISFMADFLANFGLADEFVAIKDTISDAVDDIIGFFSNIKTEAQAMIDIVESIWSGDIGIKEGIVAIGTGLLNTFSTLAEGVINVPFNAIDKFLNTIHDVKISISKWSVQPFQWVRGFGQDIIDLPSFGTGIANVPFDMIGQIHKEEMIIPAPEARQIRAGRGAGGLTLSMQVIFEEGAIGSIRDDSDIDTILEGIEDRVMIRIAGDLKRLVGPI